MICYACYCTIDEENHLACCEKRDEDREENVWWHIIRELMSNL